VLEDPAREAYRVRGYYGERSENSGVSMYGIDNKLGCFANSCSSSSQIIVMMRTVHVPAAASRNSQTVNAPENPSPIYESANLPMLLIEYRVFTGTKIPGKKDDMNESSTLFRVPFSSEACRAGAQHSAHVSIPSSTRYSHSRRA
jgi:hypothetical protein